jgi:hypothetical protein
MRDLEAALEGGQSVRNLLDIIEFAKDGHMPTHEECFYGMLAYQAMFNMDHQNLIDVLMDDKPKQDFIKKLKAENSHKMLQAALSKSPKDWLGANWDPLQEQCQKQRQMHKKIFDKFMEQKQAEEEGER